MIKQLDLSVIINYDTEKDEIISYLTTLNGVQEKKTTTTTRKSSKKNTLEGLCVVREDNKLILSEELVKELKAQPEDKIVIQYERDQESKTVFPVIALESTLNNGGGNKLTKSNTVAYRGKANNTLSEFGTNFEVKFHKEGIYKLIGDSNISKDIEIAQAVKEVDLGIDVISDEVVEIEDMDFNF
jgi:hypothetical protein